MLRVWALRETETGGGEVTGGGRGGGVGDGRASMSGRRWPLGARWPLAGVALVAAACVTVTCGQGFDTPVINIRQGGLRGVSTEYSDGLSECHVSEHDARNERRE